MYCECPDNGEMIYNQVTKMVKARKAHKCGECGETITEGTKYERITGFISGEPPWVHKTCEFCAKVRADLESYGFCMLYGCMWDDIRNGEEEAAEELAWEERQARIKEAQRDG
jgi:hypothetical protein